MEIVIPCFLPGRPGSVVGGLDGRDALEMASEYGYEEIADLLSTRAELS